MAVWRAAFVSEPASSSEVEPGTLVLLEGVAGVCCSKVAVASAVDGTSCLDQLVDCCTWDHYGTACLA